MKKLFLITIIFANNLLTTSNSNNEIKYRVTRGYSNYASIESLYAFIPELIDWNPFESEKFILTTINTDDKKELCILRFQTSKDKPIRILYTVDNTNDDPNFTQNSIWGDTIREQIDTIFDQKITNCNSTQKEHLLLLQKTIHCKNSTYIHFIPQPMARIEQFKINNTRTDAQILRLQRHYQTTRNPLMQNRRQRTNTAEDENDETPLAENETDKKPWIPTFQGPETSPFSSLSRSPSPSPENPFKEL